MECHEVRCQTCYIDKGMQCVSGTFINRRQRFHRKSSPLLTVMVRWIRKTVTHNRRRACNTIRRRKGIRWWSRHRKRTLHLWRQHRRPRDRNLSRIRIKHNYANKSSLSGNSQRHNKEERKKTWLVNEGMLLIIVRLSL